DAYGCYNLGLMYYNGQGVKQNYFMTVELFKQACAYGDVQGCKNYIQLIRSGY
ncbi:MAG: SEL1-like repeat protein, partial [Sulfurimonas sp.]|nr:SEL1-like repeat protein [Sulfurimonas sp.]